MKEFSVNSAIIIVRGRINHVGKTEEKQNAHRNTWYK